MNIFGWLSRKTTATPVDTRIQGLAQAQQAAFNEFLTLYRKQDADRAAVREAYFKYDILRMERNSAIMDAWWVNRA